MKSTDRICFLDIDGVLNSGRGHMEMCSGVDVPIIHYNLGDYVEMDKLKMFQNFVQKWQIKIVGVSSWFTFKNEHKAIAECLGLPIVATGYNTGGGLERGKGVLRWVDDYRLTKWFVLDDAGDHMYDFTHNRVDVDGYYGLQGEDLMVAEKWIA